MSYGRDSTISGIWLIASCSGPRPGSLFISASPPIAAGPLPAFELSIIAPAFNEAANLAMLAERIDRALPGIAWQLLIVDDDSPDGTAETAKALARADARVACIKRLKRRGLAGAVIEGVLASAAPYVAVMDADLQHDETLLPLMLSALREGRADLVIGSRYVAAGSAKAGLSKGRSLVSRIANRLARLALKAEVADPVSGFFMVGRRLFDEAAPRLSDQGFKILFDLIACTPAPLRILELPYSFAARRAGESKLDAMAVTDYLGLVVARLSGNLIPQRALLFFAVGASGLVINLAAAGFFLGLGLRFALAQTVAAVIAMTSNYLINNEITYRDRRLRGLRLLLGYFRFCALCGVGLIANVAVAELVHRILHQTPQLWWVATLAGAIFGAVWNYVSTSLAVW